MGGQTHSNPYTDEKNKEQTENSSNESASVSTGSEEVKVREEATPPETSPVEENAEVVAEEATANTEQ